MAANKKHWPLHGKQRSTVQMWSQKGNVAVVDGEIGAVGTGRGVSGGSSPLTHKLCLHGAMDSGTNSNGRAKEFALEGKTITRREGWRQCRRQRSLAHAREPWRREAGRCISKALAQQRIDAGVAIGSDRGRGLWCRRRNYRTQPRCRRHGRWCQYQR